MERNVKRKSFEELMVGLEVDIDEPRDLPEGKEITNEEVDIRAQVYLNGYEQAERGIRKGINNISFQLNRKFVKGCQAGELLQFYNERIGGFLDDLIY